MDTPIAELGFAGIAVGAAMNGLRPIVEFMTFNFSLVAIDQVVNAAAKMLSMSGGNFGIPMVFRGPTGSAGQLGAQHSQSFENWYANCPGLKVVVPSNPADAKGLLKSSIRDNDPVIFMESEQMYGLKGEVPEGEYMIPLGKARVIVEGNDASIICYGSTVHMALEVAERMQKEGVSIEVVDIRTLVPFDEETVLQSFRKTNRVLITHEAALTGGFASEISACITENAFDSLDAPIKRVAAFDSPTPFAPTLEKAMLPNADKIHAELLHLLSY